MSVQRDPKIIQQLRKKEQAEVQKMYKAKNWFYQKKHSVNEIRGKILDEENKVSFIAT